MSLYNLMNGVNQSTFYILPMLEKHPDGYPRFRDCFLWDAENPEYDDHIIIYTRTGGGNRDDYEVENEAMRQMEGFVTDYDDSFDCTYASWVFKVPDKWKPDFDKIKEGDLMNTSDEYKALLIKVYPKLEEHFTEMFKKE